MCWQAYTRLYSSLIHSFICFMIKDRLDVDLSANRILTPVIDKAKTPQSQLRKCSVTFNCYSSQIENTHSDKTVNCCRGFQQYPLLLCILPNARIPHINYSYWRQSTFHLCNNIVAFNFIVEGTAFTRGYVRHPQKYKKTHTPLWMSLSSYPSSGIDGRSAK